MTASSFSVTTGPDGNGLATNAAGGGPLTFLIGEANLPNASYSWSVATTNPLQYTGGQVRFAPDQSPHIQHDEDVPWYDWALLAALGIAGAPALASMIYDAVNGFGDQVNNAGVDALQTTMQQAIGGTVVNLASLVDWRTGDGKAFTATDAGLAGAFYVRGNFQ